MSVQHELNVALGKCDEMLRSLDRCVKHVNPKSAEAIANAKFHIRLAQDKIGETILSEKEERRAGITVAA